jgi:hypothetical protein
MSGDRRWNNNWRDNFIGRLEKCQVRSEAPEKLGYYAGWSNLQHMKRSVTGDRGLVNDKWQGKQRKWKEEDSLSFYSATEVAYTAKSLLDQPCPTRRPRYTFLAPSVSTLFGPIININTNFKTKNILECLSTVKYFHKISLKHGTVL